MGHVLVDDSVFHVFFDKDAAPVARACSGDLATFVCRDCYDGEIAHDYFDFKKINMKNNNPASGPLYVEGAEPGDVLKVEILSIDLADHGCMSARPGVGVYEIDAPVCRTFSIHDGCGDIDGVLIPLKPMIGVIGTAPAGEPESTQTPGEHGGNLDIRNMNAGNTLYLPVNVPGALLSMGDLHGVQGDGETVICALEAPGRVTVRLTVLKSRSVPTPFLVSPTHYMTTAADASLDVCSVQAARKMHRFLMEHGHLDAAKAGMLLSLQGNLRISQVVNPKKGCIMEFPKGLIPIDFEE